MDTVQSVSTHPAEQQSGKSREEIAVERLLEFQKVLKEFDAEQAKMEEERKAARKEREEQHHKDNRIAAVRARIARLRSQLYVGGELDRGVAAQLSAAESELFWLLFSF